MASPLTCQTCSPTRKIASAAMVALVKRTSFNTQGILVAPSEICLDKLANLTDKIIKVTQFLSLLAGNTVSSCLMTLFWRKIYALSHQVAKLSALIPRHSLSICKVHSIDRARDSSQTRSKETGWCRYHLKFKNNAIKCISPCSFQESSPSNL